MHSGTYRYKRLLFGASSVSEQYQHEVATVLAGIEGVANISDYHHPHARPWDTGPTTTCCTGEAREMRPDLKWREGQFEMDKLVFINLTLARWISFHLAPIMVERISSGDSQVTHHDKYNPLNAATKCKRRPQLCDWGCWLSPWRNQPNERQST